MCGVRQGTCDRWVLCPEGALGWLGALATPCVWARVHVNVRNLGL